MNYIAGVYNKSGSRTRSGYSSLLFLDDPGLRFNNGLLEGTKPGSQEVERTVMELVCKPLLLNLKHYQTNFKRSD